MAELIASIANSAYRAGVSSTGDTLGRQDIPAEVALSSALQEVDQFVCVKALQNTGAGLARNPQG
jgi:hypothetical protein